MTNAVVATMNASAIPSVPTARNTWKIANAMKNKLPDVKLPIRAYKGSLRRNFTSAARGGRSGNVFWGMIDRDLARERFERASLAEDKTRHLRVPFKIKLGEPVEKGLF